MAKYMGGECGKNFTFLSQERSSGFSIKGLSIQARWAIINRKEESRKVYSQPPHLFPYPKFYIITNKTQLYEIIFLFNFFIPKSVNKKIKLKEKLNLNLFEENTFQKIQLSCCCVASPTTYN